MLLAATRQSVALLLAASGERSTQVKTAYAGHEPGAAARPARAPESLNLVRPFARRGAFASFGGALRRPQVSSWFGNFFAPGTPTAGLERQRSRWNRSECGKTGPPQ